jgi:hypothetical protein
MKIEPIDEIVPLKIDSPQVEENLHRLALLVEDVRNFGTYIIRSVFIDDKGINEFVRSVVSCFLRQMVEDLDAISIQIKQSSSDPCYLNLRRLFENYIYLKFVLKDKSEERAKAYYVNHLLKKRKLAEEEDSSTSSGKELRAKLAKDEHAKYFPPSTQDCKSKVDSIDAILQKSRYQSIKFEFDKRKREKKKTKWYSLFDGPDSLESLSASVGCSGQYYLYRFYSRYAHSENELENIDAEGNSLAGLVQIRNPENAQQIVQMALNYALFSFQTALKSLRPQCLKCFRHFYIDNLRLSISELKNVKIINVIRK